MKPTKGSVFSTLLCIFFLIQPVFLHGQVKSKTTKLIKTTKKIDLVVSRLSVSPRTVVAGESFSVNCRIKNNGPDTSDSFKVRIYFSNDSRISTSDTVLETLIVSGGVRGTKDTSGSSPALANFSILLSLPTGTGAGKYYIGAIVDYNNQVKETNETNNTRFAPLTVSSALPDLRVKRLTAVPRRVPAGDVVRIGNVIVNEGRSDSGEFEINYVISPDYRITNDDTRIHSVYIRNIPKGGSYEFPTSTKTIAMRIPEELRPGSYYVGAIVDYRGRVEEADERNNTKQTPVTVTPPEKPDLFIKDLTVEPTTVKPGEYIRKNYQVRNAGERNSGQYKIKFYLSKDSRIDSSDIYLGSTHTLPSIRPGTNYSSSAPSRNMVPEDIIPGIWYFVAFVDGFNDVDEKSEGNNTRIKRITISELIKPDLIFKTFSVDPRTCEPGGEIRISSRVADEICHGGYNFKVGFYLSGDAFITTSDTNLLTRTISFALNPFRHPSASINVSVNIPEGTSPGTYFIGGIIDTENRIDERDETNNTDKIRITVTPPAIPDLKAISLRVSPTNIKRGGRFTVTSTIKNIGNLNSGSFEIIFYYSSDSIITKSDYVLGGATVVDIAKGVTHSLSKRLSLHPAAKAGTGYIGMIVDSGNDVRESSEANNIKYTNIIIAK